MYANLSVRVGDGEPQYAWKIEVDPQRGEMTVHLDDNDGGSYAEPAGEVKLDLRDGPPVTIAADF